MIEAFFVIVPLLWIAAFIWWRYEKRRLRLLQSDETEPWGEVVHHPRRSWWR